MKVVETKLKEFEAVIEKL